MKPRYPFHLRLLILRVCLFPLAAALLTQLPVGCVFEDGPSTETGNPNLRGTLRDAEGRPTTGFVKLYLLPTASNPDSAALNPPRLIQSRLAGADGKYRFDSLPPAVYALEATDVDERLFSLAPGLALASAKDTLIRNLSLKEPAQLTGTVTRGTNQLPEGVTDDRGILVRLGGADRSAISDSLGHYDLGQVPDGVYRIAFAAPDGHYEPAFLDTVHATSGVARELPLVELSWSRFQAPPPPTGLSIVADSATGTVRLAWRPVKLANLAFYEVARIDSADSAHNAVFRTVNTTFTDTLKGLSGSRVLLYRIVTVNALGNRSPAGPAQTRPAVVPARPDTVEPDTGAGTGAKTGYLAGVVLSPAVRLANVKVMLYSVPAAPGSPDSAPLPVRLLDSAFTGADGRYRFRGLGGPGTYPVPGNPVSVPGIPGGPKRAGRYAVIALGASGDAALRTDISARLDSTALDTLFPQPTGAVAGMASRDSQWVTNPEKTDMNIPVSLAGTPFRTHTDFLLPNAGARFSLANVPAGRYRLVVYTPPNGYFLPDTLEVVVTPGTVTTLPGVINARYNPSAPPPKIATLSVVSSTRASVRLSWKAMAKYDILQGYRVLRLDGDLMESARSGVVTDTTWTDDLSALPRGSLWYYVVRVVDTAGRESPNGGGMLAQPISFTVP